MKNLINLFCLIAVAAITITSCKKYEEGPSLSLRSKKARLCGDWKIEQFLINGNDSTSAFTAVVGANYSIDIEKDGKYKMKGNLTSEGSWELGEDKDDVYFTSSAAGSTEQAFRILKLENKELWWKQQQSNGDVEEYHFVPED